MQWAECECCGVHVRWSLEASEFYQRVPQSAFYITVHDAVRAAKVILRDDPTMLASSLSH